MTTKEDKLVPAKRKLFYSLVDFVNVCSSVGSNSDKNLKNQVTREIEYYSDSKRAKKLTTSGWPTKQEFESAKTAALNAAKNYNLNVFFIGDDDYKGSTAAAKVTITKKKTAIKPAKTKYTFKAKAKSK